MKHRSRIAITEWVKEEATLKFHDSLDILLSQNEAKKLLAGLDFYSAQEIKGYSLAGITQWYIIFERRRPSSPDG